MEKAYDDNGVVGPRVETRLEVCPCCCEEEEEEADLPTNLGILQHSSFMYISRLSNQ